MGKKLQATGTGVVSLWDKIFTLTFCAALGAGIVATLVDPKYWVAGALAALAGRLVAKVMVRW